MTDRADRAREHLDFLERQVGELESLADQAAVGHGDAPPQIGAAVSARAKAAELAKRVEQIRDWVARQPPKASWKRGKQSAKQPQALLLLCAGRSTTEVATELGVDRRTVNRWRADPEFDEELRSLQQAQSDAVHAFMVAQQLEVVRCLAAVATGPDTQDMARVHACRVFLETLGKSKTNPVAPTEREGEIETEDDVVEALSDIPSTLLQRVIEARAARSAAKRDRREKDL